MKKILSLLGATGLALASVVSVQGQAPHPIDTVTRSGNPIITDKYTADPAAIVHNDTVYLYVGHDQASVERNFYDLREWLVYRYGKLERVSRTAIGKGF